MENKEWREVQDIFGDDASPESVIATTQELISSDYSQANHIVVPYMTFRQNSQNIVTGTKPKTKTKSTFR